MEYLAPEDQDLARKGLDGLRVKLPTPQEDVLENLKSNPEQFAFHRGFRVAKEYSNRCLPTASIIWEYLLGKAENKQQKFAVMDKLFHVQIATGPWNIALETAKNLFNETMAYSLDSTTGQSEESLDPSQTGQLLFDACLNLASIYRLRRELHTAEDLYRKAWDIAASMKDFDRETSAKIHLAICLLDRGELKEAIETYFKPLMVFKSNMSYYTRALYLQYYGNACRSAADWGRAKEYLREALDLAKEVRDAGLVSSCCGDLGNVFRSEGRYKDAERLHTSHYNFALTRGDIHGLAIACGNIGFLKFYNPGESDDALVYQFIEYALAEQVGDCARMGVAFNKIGKLYTTLGYFEEAVELFKIALDSAQRAKNVAGEGMAWGNLGTVYRALEQYEDAIACHIKYRDNAERRLDTGGLAIMQHQLAMDYFLSGNLPEAERSILSAFQTLEVIRAQIGKEDKSKLSNFEKNQAEAYNLLQVVLVAQKKYKEAFVLADASRGRALSEIVRKRLCGSNSSGTETNCINEEFITESFCKLLKVSRNLSTSLVLYSVVKEFDQTGAIFTWVYTWVLHPTGRLHFCKNRLQSGINTKVELNDEFVVSLRRSIGLQSSSDDLSKILRCEKLLGEPREGKAQLATLQDEGILESLNGLEHMFATGWESDSDVSFNSHSFWNTPFKAKEKGRHERPAFDTEERLSPEAHDGTLHIATSQLNSLQQGTHSSIAKPIALEGANLSPEPEVYQGIVTTEFDKADSSFTIEETPPEVLLTPSLLQDSDATKSENIQDHLPPHSGMPGDTSSDSINGAVRTDPSGAHSREAACGDVCTFLMQGSNHTETEEHIQDPLSLNNDVCEDSPPAPISDNLSDPSSTYSKETAGSGVFSSPMQIKNHIEAEQDIQDPSTPNNEICEDTPPDSINDIVTDLSCSHSMETASSFLSTSLMQLIICTEPEENIHDPLASNNDDCEDNCPGHNVATETSATNSMETANNDALAFPTQSPNYSELKENVEYPLDLECDDTSPGPLSDIVPDPLGTHSKEAASSEVSTSLMQIANHNEIEEDIQEPLAPNSEVSESTLPGHPETEEVIQDLSAPNNEARDESRPSTVKDYLTSATPTNPIQSGNDIEVEEEKLDPFAPNYDFSASTLPDLINDKFSMPTDTLKTNDDDLQDDPELAPWRPMLNQLHKILIEPIMNFLPGKDESPRITFIPQDFLLKVPFSALQGATEQRYVIEDFVISTSPSIHFLELASSVSREKNTALDFSLLAVGNPKMPFEELPQLPSAQHEVRMISEIVNSEDSKVFIGARATKENVVAAMPKHDILHFATHAVIDDSDSHGDFNMKGLIVLAKSGNECNGLLTAEEVRKMDLKAELVVLSCCDTGLGKVTGDGVLGLSRAFLAAGASCVIVTLWKIDDRSASELMTSFYREYKTTHNAAVSLQKAMKMLQAKKDTRSPRHWAAFSIVGATG